jgi:hypothetical protein
VWGLGPLIETSFRRPRDGRGNDRQLRGLVAPVALAKYGLPAEVPLNPWEPPDDAAGPE